MIYCMADPARGRVGAALHGGGCFLFFGEVEIFFCLPSPFLTRGGDAMYMTWEEFLLFAGVIIAVIELVIDLMNKKR